MSDNGWKYIDTDDMWHFFMHGMSLCHEWMTINHSDKEHKDEDERNCKECVDILSKTKKANQNLSIEHFNNFKKKQRKILNA